ncbi:hypothetical protein TPHA_0E02290 [Tetrapisispora phaffii CBS 4417]|uniref:Dipeptidyl aminopeptidase B n=1 Tax=Tetrapisispora phaffii (strain ATCC 24235 / CBS 4417 / NBRC 1672 / NRRL Y-8282 / UCD 70-5) TaxID=1071381 RepID=G8BTU3_TETPH|nr:hypothetical protein TPHA_0E02290 [Tetrapisispora phaffii CBS 4417]CCE63321.1 hypothetical protein TPHA_0E02290 [Tetrapisispora phaffii CBS 4417]
MTEFHDTEYQSFGNEPEDLRELTQRKRERVSYYSNRYFKPSIILILLIWGSYLLINTVETFYNTNKSKEKLDTPNSYKLPNSLVTDNGQLKVNFNNVRNNTFVPEFHSLQWIKNDVTSDNLDMGLYMTYIDEKYLIKSVYDKEYEKVLFHGKKFEYDGKSIDIDSIIASSNLKYLIIKANVISNWRHSTLATYFEYDIKKKSIKLIGDNISFVEWSPNSNEIAYVQDNDIFIYSIAESKTIIRVTADGNTQIFNGRPDWVYEEEVLENDKALWWSEKGDYLSFLKIDETNVNEYTIPYFVQEASLNLVSPYPEMRSIKYPKSGTPNPTVDVWIFKRQDRTSYPAKISSVIRDSADTEIKALKWESLLVTEVVWIGNTHVLIKTSDRSSEVLTILLIEVENQKTIITRQDTSIDGWWEISHDLLYVSSDASKNRTSDGYIDLYPVDGYNHLAYFSPANSSEPIALTRGEWEVVKGPATFDPETNDVYFIGTKKSSMERHLYKVNLHNPEKVTDITNTTEEGVYSVSFSTGSRFALLSYMGPNIPYQKIVDFKSSNYDDKKVNSSFQPGETLYYLETNEKLAKRMELYSVPARTFRELNIGEDNDGNDILVNSYEILPDNFDPEKKNYYPVFFYAYGGPNSQQVVESFAVGFNEVAAAQLDAIVVVVDGRGTGFKGGKFRYLVRDNLGDVEAQDQISAAKLYSKKPYVDAEKISLFGWSYGGYLTLKTLEKDAGKYFKYGISVAPVIDWRFYDSVYTERYMHTPQENDIGYQKSKVSNVTAIGESQRFLLMHGTGDDNVHFQNSMKFLDLLDINEVENYDVHVFPDSDHSIRHHNANDMLYNRLLNWVKLAYTDRFHKDTLIFQK